MSDCTRVNNKMLLSEARAELRYLDRRIQCGGTGISEEAYNMLISSLSYIERNLNEIVLDKRQ